MIHQLSALIKNTAIYSAFGVIARLQTFLLLPIYVRYLTVEEVGVQDWLIMISGFISVMVSIEICQGLERQIGLAGEDEEYRSNAIRSALIFFVSCNLLALVCFQIFASQISSVLFNTGGYTTHIKIASLTFFGAAGYIFVYNLNRYLLEARRAAVVSYIQSSGTLLSGLFLVVGMKMGLVGSLLAPLIGAVLAVATSLPALLPVLRKGQFQFQILSKMLTFSAPMVPATIAFVLMSFVDRLMISRFLGAEPLGIYAVGFKIGLIVTVLLMGLQAAMMPLVYRYEKEADTKIMLATSFLAFIAFCLFCILNMGLLSTQLIHVVATADYLQAAILIPFLAIAALFTRLYFFLPGMNIAGRTVLYAGIHIAVFGANIGLNYILIQRYGILGASIATYLSALILFTLLYHFSQRHYFVEHKIHAFIMLFCVVHALLFGFHLMQTMLGLTLVNQVLFLGLANLCYLGLIFKLGLVQRRHLDQIRHLLNWRR